MRDVALTVASVGDLSAEFVLLPGVELVSQRFWHMANPDQLDWDSMNEIVAEQVAGQAEALGGVVDLYYEAVDAIVGDLLELAAEGATVALVSDHGYDGLRYDARGHPMLGPHMHSEHGFWVLTGPRVRRAVRVSDLGLLDFAPTVAEAYGIALTDETDGSVCEEMIAR
jgi:predicted AlkP superfamily phosphohydrolase/phosphomutase